MLTPRARRRAWFLIIASVLAPLAPHAAYAQAPSFDASLSPIFAAPYPAQWQTTNSLANMTVTNTSGETATADLQISIFREGVLVGSTPPLNRSYPAAVSLYPTYQITEWARMGFTGQIRKAVDASGRLPDGTYLICADFSNVRTVSGVLLSPVHTCTTFLVFYPKPPSLVFPEDESVVSVPQPIFQWTPVMSQAGRQLPHWFRLVEVLPNQEPTRAIEANRPIYEIILTNRSSLPYPLSAPTLTEGRTYAWRVQAVFPFSSDPKYYSHLSYVGQQGAPSSVRSIGENDGRSRVHTFTWTSDPARAAKLKAARAGSGPASGTRVGSYGDGEGPSENFADRLIRVMASVWHRGTGSTSAAARSAGTARIERPETADERVAPGPDRPVEAADSPGEPATNAAPEDSTMLTSTVMPTMQPPGLGPNWAKLHGTASARGETYSRDGSGEANRPDRSALISTGLTVGVMGDRLQVPVSALVSDDQVSFRQNINQFAVAPRWQWAGFTAGNLSPQYSSYTLADASILGGGLELAPKQWRLGFVSGRSRKAITPTTSYPVTPQFERNVTAGRIGYGDPAANSIEVSIMRARDDGNSLAGAESTFALSPEANTVYAARVQRVMPSRHLRAQVETALSQYDRDRRADAPKVDGRAIGLQLFHETALSHVGVKAEYLDGGFMTLGNSGITGDRIDLGVNARVQMLQGKLSLDGSAGVRNDGANTSVTPDTRRRNYGLNGSWQPGFRFGADMQLAVYETKSDAADSLLQGTSNTTRLYSISPRTTWNVGRVQNSLSCSAMLQKSQNGSGGIFLGTESLTLSGNWAAAISPPWTVTFSGNYTKTDQDVSVSEVSSFGPGFTWAAFRSKLLTSAQLQIMRSRSGNAGTDSDLAPRLETRWEFAPRQAFVLRGNFRRFRYAGEVTPEFIERTASLEYVTNL